MPNGLTQGMLSIRAKPPPTLKEQEDELKLMRMEKKRKALKRAPNQTLDKINDKIFAPVEKVEIDVSGRFKTRYTAEENYRAYKLFSIMDVDGGGSITIREVLRVLMGDTVRTFFVEFEHVDNGCLWSLDADDSVIIESIEPSSPAADKPALVRGLQLLSINGRKIQQNNKKSLQDLMQYSLQLNNDRVIYEFLEPLMILSPFTYMLDIQVETRLFSIVMPIGAVYNIPYFIKQVKGLLCKAHKSFKFMKMGVIKRSRQIFFKCDKFKFRFLFLSGPSAHISCRFALGFAAEDYPAQNLHIGQPMAIDLNLGLSLQETELLIAEIFAKFDTDGSGEFEFEEFRDFYVKFLDTEKSIEILRNFGQYRFRDVELETWWFAKQDARKHQRDRINELKVLNAPFKKAQLEKFMNNSFLYPDNVRRRTYGNERPRELIMSNTKPKRQRFKFKKKKWDETEGINAENLESIIEEKNEKVKKLYKPTITKSKFGLGVNIEKEESSGNLIIKEILKLPDSTPNPCLFCDPPLKVGDVLLGVNGKPVLSLDDVSEIFNQVSESESVTLWIEREEDLQAGAFVSGSDDEKDGAISGSSLDKFYLASKVSSRKSSFSQKGEETKEEKGVTDDDSDDEGVLLPNGEMIEHMIYDEDVLAGFDDDKKSLTVSTTSKKLKKSKKSSKHSDDGSRSGIGEKSEESSAVKTVVDDLKTKREQAKEKMRKQALERKKKVDALVGQRAKEDRKTEKALKLMQKSEFVENMEEVNLVIKAGVSYAMSMAADMQGTTGIRRFKQDLAKYIATPALKLNAACLNADSTANDIVLENLPSSLIHPACFRYFMIPDKRKAPDFDSTKRHPAFFTAEFERKPSRHSTVAMKCCNVLAGDWQEGVIYRARNNVKRCTNLPPDEQLKWQKKTVHWVEPPPIPKPNALIGQATVMKITCSSLIKASILLENSPFVKMSCGVESHSKYAFWDGDFRSCTEIHLHAGSRAEWGDLDWKFRVHADHVIICDVYSGSSVHHELIGTCKFSGRDFVSVQPDFYGEAVCHGELTIGDGRPAGLISITMKLEQGEEWDWFVTEWQRGEKLKKKEDRFIRKLKEKENAPSARDVGFPLYLDVLSIQLIDLHSAHFFSKNSPYIEVECGSWKHTSEVRMFSADNAKWDDISWLFGIVSENANLIFMVNSGTMHIGRFTINGFRLAKLPRTRSGIIEIQDFISKIGSPQTQTGRIVIKMKIRFDNQFKDKDDGGSVVSGSIATNTSQSTDTFMKRRAGGSLATSANSSLDGLTMSDTSSFHSKGIFAGNILSPNKKEGVKGKLPCRVKIYSASLINLVPVHGVFKNSPRLVFTCGPWTDEFPRAEFAGKSADWVADPVLEVPLTERVNLVASVYSDEVFIGSYTITATNLVDFDRDHQGCCDILDYLLEGSEIRGQIKLNVGFDHDAEVGFIQKILTDLPEKNRIKYKELPTMTGYSAITSLVLNNTVDKGDRTFHENKPYQYNYIPSMPVGKRPTEFPYRMNIKSILATDLRGVHIMRPNSPFLNVACGQWATKSAEVSNGGSNANFPGLEWGFFVQQHNSLRVGVWSGSTNIGSGTASPADILNAPMDNSGVCEILMALFYDQRRAAGKIKITFTLEAKNDDTNAIGMAYAPAEIILEPPLLVTVYTINISDVKPVHAFFQNNLICKGVCGLWKGATTVSDVGDSGKWEHLMWSIYLGANMEIKLTLYSGSIVIGYISIMPEDLIKTPIDVNGLTEFEGFFTNGKQFDGIVGRIRIVCRCEAHEEVALDEEEDIDELPDDDYRAIKVNTINDLSRVNTARTVRTADSSAGAVAGDLGSTFKPGTATLGSKPSTALANIGTKPGTANASTPKPNSALASGSRPTTTSGVSSEIIYRKIPKLTKLQIIAISVKECRSVHTISPNSPYVRIECGKQGNMTQSQYLSGKSAVWLDLDWNVYMKRSTSFRATVCSGTTIVGAVVIKTSELWGSKPDDAGDTLIERFITIDGEGTGKIRFKVRLSEQDPSKLSSFKDIAEDIEDIEYDEEGFEISDYFSSKRNDVYKQKGYTPPALSKDSIVTVPCNVVIERISVVDMVSLHHFVSNSPRIKMKFEDAQGPWNRESPPIFKAGRYGQWNELSSWSFVALEKESILSMDLISENVYGGSFSISIGELLKLPRNNSRKTELRGHFKRPENLTKSMGKFHVEIDISNFVSQEKKIEIDEAREADFKKKLLGPDPLAYMKIYDIQLKNLYQIFGLFKNSPKVRVRSGDWLNETPIASNAGASASWTNLHWTDTPIYPGKSVEIQVSSGNEVVGNVKITMKDIDDLLKVTEVKELNEAIIGKDIFDGAIYKGSITLKIFAQKIDRETKSRMKAIDRKSHYEDEEESEEEDFSGDDEFSESNSASEFSFHQFNEVANIVDLAFNSSVNDESMVNTNNTVNQSSALTDSMHAQESFDNINNSTIHNQASTSVITDSFTHEIPNENSFIAESKLDEKSETFDEDFGSQNSLVTGSVNEEGTAFNGKFNGSNVEGSMSLMSGEDESSRKSKSPEDPLRHLHFDGTKFAVPAASKFAVPSGFGDNSTVGGDTLDGEYDEGNDDNEYEEGGDGDDDTFGENNSFYTMEGGSIDPMSVSGSTVVSRAKSKGSKGSRKSNKNKPKDSSGLLNRSKVDSIIPGGLPDGDSDRHFTEGEDAVLNSDYNNIIGGDIKSKYNNGNNSEGGEQFKDNFMNYPAPHHHHHHASVDKEIKNENENRAVISAPNGTADDREIASSSAKNAEIQVAKPDRRGKRKKKGGKSSDQHREFDARNIIKSFDADKLIDKSDIMDFNSPSSFPLFSPEKDVSIVDANESFNSSIAESSVAARPLSINTPTPAIVKFNIEFIECDKLVPLHVISKNSPFVRMSCGDWRNSTPVAKNAGSRAVWMKSEGTAWSFIMKQMMFIKFVAYDGEEIIGTTVISTREILEVSPNHKGLIIIDRVLERDSYDRGRIRIAFNLESRDLKNPSVKDTFLMTNLHDTSLLKAAAADPNSITSEATFSAIKEEFLEFPITITLHSLSIIDLVAKYFPHAVSLECIITGTDYIKNFQQKFAIGGGAIWDNVGWEFTIFDSNCELQLKCLSSGAGLLGSYNLKMKDLMDFPRDEQKFFHVDTFITKIGKSADENSVKEEEYKIGKLYMCFTINNFVSPERKQILIDKEKNAIKNKFYSEKASNGILNIPLCTLSDVNSMFRKVKLAISINNSSGTWSAESALYGNDHGNVIIPCSVWSNINVFERSEIFVSVISDRGKVIGKASFNCFDLFHGTRDAQHKITLQCAVTEGFVIKGNLKLVAELTEIIERVEETESESESESEPEVIIEVKKEVKKKKVIKKKKVVKKRIEEKKVPTKGWDFEKLKIMGIKATNLRSVHKLGKNSPSVRMGSDRWNMATDTKPYAGDKCEWVDLQCDFPLGRMSRILCVCSSQGAKIGEVKFENKEVLELVKAIESGVISDAKDGNNPIGWNSSEGCGTFSCTLALTSEQVVTGNLEFVFQFESKIDFEALLVQRKEEEREKEEDRRNGVIYDDSESAEELGEGDEGGGDSANEIENGNENSLDKGDSSIQSGAAFIEKSNEKVPILPIFADMSDLQKEVINSIMSHRSDTSQRLKSSRKNSHRSETDRSDPMDSYRSSIYSNYSGYSRSERSDRSGSFYTETDRSHYSSDYSSEYSYRSDDASNRSMDSDRYSTDRSDKFKSERIEEGHEDDSAEDDESRKKRVITNKNTFNNSSFYAALKSWSPNKNVKLDSNDPNRIKIRPIKLNWFPLNASTEEIIRVFSMDYITALTANTLKTMVAIETTVSFNPEEEETKKEVYDLSLTYRIFAAKDKRGIAYEMARDFCIKLYEQSIKRNIKFGGKLEKIPIWKEIPGYLGQRRNAINVVQGETSMHLREHIMSFSPEKSIIAAHSLQKRNADLTFGAVRGLANVPMRARITVLDLLGIDISRLDPRIIPKRPYLTACKPYGNWAGETPPAYKGVAGLTKKDMILNWYDLSGRYKWEKLIARLGQWIVFDLHDGASGLIFAKMKVRYEDVVSTKADEDGVIAMYTTFDFANEFGGGQTGAVLRLHIDLSVNVYVRPPKIPEHWEKMRIHHWRTYPLTPVAIGSCRQKHPEIAILYDKQMIIHPAFYGFKVRWTGHRTDEARFTHPCFMDFSLDKKPLSKLEREKAELAVSSSNDPNPFKWDPMAAAEGRCPVCGDGLPGCPRCFMIPSLKSGDKLTVLTFEFNPDKEKQRRLDEEHAKLRELVNNSRKGKRNKEIEDKLAQKSLSDKGGDDESLDNLLMKEMDELEEENYRVPEFHTQYTTIKSLRLWRNYFAKSQTVYIRVMPTGYVKRLLVESTHTVFDLYNMFHSHSHFGNSKDPMLLLPTNIGYFEMSNSIIEEDEFNRADNTGREPLYSYGFREKGAQIVLLYFANYMPLYTSSLLETYFEKNSLYSIKKDLPTQVVIGKLAEYDVTNDVVQGELRKIIRKQYAFQQEEEKTNLRKRAKEFWEGETARKMAKEKEIKDKRKQEEIEKKAAQRRIESQLKASGLEGAELEAMRAALEEREMSKKGSMSDADKAKALDKAKKQRERAEKMRLKRLGLSSPVTGTTADGGDDAEENNNDKENLMLSGRSGTISEGPDFESLGDEDYQDEDEEEEEEEEEGGGEEVGNNNEDEDSDFGHEDDFSESGSDDGDYVGDNKSLGTKSSQASKGSDHLLDEYSQHSVSVGSASGKSYFSKFSEESSTYYSGSSQTSGSKSRSAGSRRGSQDSSRSRFDESSEFTEDFDDNDSTSLGSRFKNIDLYQQSGPSNPLNVSSSFISAESLQQTNSVNSSYYNDKDDDDGNSLFSDRKSVKETKENNSKPNPSDIIREMQTSKSVDDLNISRSMMSNSHSSTIRALSRESARSGSSYSGYSSRTDYSEDSRATGGSRTSRSASSYGSSDWSESDYSDETRSSRTYSSYSGSSRSSSRSSYSDRSSDSGYSSRSGDSRRSDTSGSFVSGKFAKYDKSHETGDFEDNESFDSFGSSKNASIRSGGSGPKQSVPPPPSSSSAHRASNPAPPAFKKNPSGGLSSRLFAATKAAEELHANLPLAEQSRRNLNSPPEKKGNSANAALLERAKSAGKKGGDEGSDSD